MVFFVLSILFFFVRTISNKEYTRYFSTSESNFLFNAICMTMTCVVSAICGGVKRPSALLLVLCTVFGLIFVATVYLMLVSYAKGPMGLVTLVFHLSSVVPVLAGFLIFHEKLNLYKILGFIAVISVFILSWLDSESKSDKRQNTVYIPSRVYLPVTIAAMLLNGCLSTVQNMSVQWCEDSGIMTFNFYAYLIGAVCLWLILLICRLRGRSFGEIKEHPREFILQSLINGAGSTGGNILIMYALLTIPSTIAFPLSGSILTISSYLIGLIHYRETRTHYGILMVLLGVTSIVLLSLA